MTAHWGVVDTAAVEGAWEVQSRVFEVLRELDTARAGHEDRLLIRVAIESLDTMALEGTSAGPRAQGD